MIFTRQSAQPLARGERTAIRRFERADVDRWLAWPQHTDPLFWDYNPPEMSRRQRDLYFRSRLEAPEQRMYAVDDEHGAMIGRVSLREINGIARTAVFGITFTPTRLGQGYGSDALKAFLRYYFEGMRMQALFLDVAAFNLRARRVYEKCGFRQIGERWGEPYRDLAGVFRLARYEALRRYFRPDGDRIHPLMVDMVIHRRDYEARRGL